MAPSLCGDCGAGVTRAMLTMARIRLERVTMPTSAEPDITGMRLIRCFSINSMMSSSEAFSSTVWTSTVITSLTRLPCVWAYSSATLPGPMMNSSQRERRFSVWVSRRRRKSPSDTTPTRL